MLQWSGRRDFSSIRKAHKCVGSLSFLWGLDVGQTRGSTRRVDGV
jgi:hypothetical protein